MSNTKPTKPALCMFRDDLPMVPHGSCLSLPIPSDNFYRLPVILADRAGPNSCEEDSNLQQIIPYLVLINEKNEVFCYTRGNGGGEAKLHAKLSIGLGGHIDDLPPENVSLRSWITKEARRELEEEVGLTVPAPIIASRLLLDHSHATDPTTGKTYVGQVHVGLLCLVPVNSADLGKSEKGVIENGNWLRVEDFTPEMWEHLEPWAYEALRFVTFRLNLGDGLHYERSFIGSE